MRVLDVGCGPGRHAHALARRGIEVLGIDITPALRRPRPRRTRRAGATFERLDARALPFDAEFDAAISCARARSACSAADGDDDDGPRRHGPRAAARRPAGAVSAFNAYFQVRYLEDARTFDAATGRRTTSAPTITRRGRASEAEVDLWTTCFTPRELAPARGARPACVVDARLVGRRRAPTRRRRPTIEHRRAPRWSAARPETSQR